MPKKERRTEEKKRKADRERVPEHIQKRMVARSTGERPPNHILTAILDSGRNVINLPAHLLSFDPISGEPFSMGPAGGDHVSHRTLERINAIRAAYPRHWLKPNGAGAIAQAEKNKAIGDRAIKTKTSISQRTVERYFAACRIRK